MTGKKILIVTQDFPPENGGIQVYLFELARHFLKRGHSVTVICPGSDQIPSPLPQEAKVIRIRIHSSWLFLPLLFRFPRLLRQGGYTHVLYAQWQGVLAEALLLKSRKRHQSLCIVHGRELLVSVFGPLQGWLSHWAFRRVSTAIPNSRAVESLLRERVDFSGRVKRIHPGVDPSRFHPQDAQALRRRYNLGEGPVILSVGRLIPRKGMDVLLRSFVQVLERIPNVRLLLGGTGPEAQALKDLADSLGLSDRVLFIGRIPEAELPLHYAQASVFVLASRQGPRDVEGFGIAFLEAGACQVPVIGTRTGGIVDAVEENVTGLLVPQEDAGSLADALTRLLENPEEARQMGLRARERILRELTWEITGDKYMELLD